jgi:hypothetical protein
MVMCSVRAMTNLLDVVDELVEHVVENVRRVRFLLEEVRVSVAR